MSQTAIPTPSTAVTGPEDIGWVVQSNSKEHNEKEVETVPSITYCKLYRYATKVDIFLIAIAITCAFLSGTVLPITVYIESNVLEKMVMFDNLEDSDNIKRNQFWRDILFLGCLYVVAGCAQCVVTYMSNAFITISAVNQSNRIRMHYLRAALNQDAVYYDFKRSGDFASKMADDMGKVMNGMGEQVTSMVSNVTLVLISLVSALLAGWKMALVCFSLVPIALLLIALAAWAADKYSKKEIESTGHASAIAEEVLSSLRTVYAFSGQQKELDRYVQPLAEARKFCIRKELFWGLSDGLIEFSMFSCYAFFFYVGIYLIINESDRYNAGIFYNVYKNVSNIGFALGGMREHLSAFGLAKGTGAHIFKLIDNVPTINPILDQGIKPNDMEGNIEFKGVKFNYPSRPGNPILKGISFNIKRGQSAAIVGATGSGKSTIIQLLCRFYDVAEGNVLIDDRDVRELSVCWLRSHVGLVSQEPVLFNTTVRENIRYGRSNATDEEIEVAARKANAHHFIVQLPKGYDTLVGERGASLSGGQKQRVAIARALVRDPRILLLDEATSALDTASEAKVQIALDKAAEGRTTIIIAHRLTTIRNVTIIHVMSKGQIVESGTHSELMNLKGQYFEMVKMEDPEYVLNLLKNDENSKLEPSVSDMGALLKGNEEDEENIPPLPVPDSLEEPKISKLKALALNKPELKYIITGCVLTLIESVALTIFGILVSYLIASIPGTKDENLIAKAINCAILFVIFGIITGQARFWQTFLFGISGAKLTERLRRLMFQQLLRQEMAYFDDKTNTTGALCARLFGEAATVRAVTGFRIGHMIMAVTQILVCILVAFYLDWRLASVSLATFPVLVTLFSHQSRSAKKESELHAKTMEESSQTAIEALSNYRTVASLGREPGVLDEYMRQLEPRRQFLLQSAQLQAFTLALNSGLRMLTTSVIMIYGGHLMIHQDLKYAIIFSLLQVSVATQQGAAMLFSYAPEVQKGYYAASRILKLLKREPKIKDPANPYITEFIGSGECDFKEVQFRYPTRPNNKILSGLNLTIEKGKTHALVGHSGCGKSTVIQLLQRYYDPDEGEITLDKLPIAELLLSDVRRTMGLVSQEPVLFDRSIAENIAYGDNARAPTRDEIVDAAKQANIHLFIVSLPSGYDTNIGPKGTQLSGGQKQCVAIARALLRKPRILLLDEATSALDAESEKMVQLTLDQARAERTCIIIAHRLSTVRDADVICVISNGRVEERGTHDHLMTLRGLYYALNRRHSID